VPLLFSDASLSPLGVRVCVCVCVCVFVYPTFVPVKRQRPVARSTRRRLLIGRPTRLEQAPERVGPAVRVMDCLLAVARRETAGALPAVVAVVLHWDVAIFVLYCCSSAPAVPQPVSAAHSTSPLETARVSGRALCPFGMPNLFRTQCGVMHTAGHPSACRRRREGEGQAPRKPRCRGRARRFGIGHSGENGAVWRPGGTDVCMLHAGCPPSPPATLPHEPHTSASVANLRLPSSALPADISCQRVPYS
jgi:hypothetical protein